MVLYRTICCIYKCLIC